MERNLLQELKVGIFVTLFLAVIAVSVFILGGGMDMFADEYQLHTKFTDVKGLKSGAIVRLAGIDIGQVANVEFSADPGSKDIEVTLTVRSTYQPRIREDSVATISQVGVLGDMYITLTVGSADKAVLEDGASIQSAQSPDLLSYADRATEIVESAASISKKVDLMLGSDEEAGKAQISQSLAHVEAMLAEAKDGKGVLHTLIYDKEAARTLKSVLSNADAVTADIADFTREVRHGEGLLHAAIYADEGEKLAARLGEAADAVGMLVGDLKEGDSLAHALLYDPEKARLVDDLQGAVSDVRGMTAAVSAGDGTLGLLVNDPALYEDMRALLGGAQRNALLRAYIRATVAKGRKETAAEFEGPEGDR